MREREREREREKKKSITNHNQYQYTMQYTIHQPAPCMADRQTDGEDRQTQPYDRQTDRQLIYSLDFSKKVT